MFTPTMNIVFHSSYLDIKLSEEYYNIVPSQNISLRCVYKYKDIILLKFSKCIKILKCLHKFISLLKKNINFGIFYCQKIN